jgi:type I site-specific restriction endonuclease
MTDEELSISDATLIARLRKYNDDLLSITADRIEGLVKERDGLLTTWAESRNRHLAAEARAEQLAATNERLKAVLRELIDHTHNCEKELTERLYCADFCGESLPLTNARTAMKEN